MYIKLKYSRPFCYKSLNHLCCSHYLLSIYMQHLLRLIWSFPQENNILEQTLIYLRTENKKLYSRLVVVTSLFPSEIIKMGRILKSHKGDVQAKYHEEPSSERVEQITSFSPSTMRGLVCHQITMNEASEGHQVHN